MASPSSPDLSNDSMRDLLLNNGEKRPMEPLVDEKDPMVRASKSELIAKIRQLEQEARDKTSTSSQASSTDASFIKVADEGATANEYGPKSTPGVFQFGARPARTMTGNKGYEGNGQSTSESSNQQQAPVKPVAVNMEDPLQDAVISQCDHVFGSLGSNKTHARRTCKVCGVIFIVCHKDSSIRVTTKEAEAQKKQAKEMAKQKIREANAAVAKMLQEVKEQKGGN